MNTIYGESPEIQMNDGYAANGGISLFSTREAGETITSSDQGGEQVFGGRILWEITDNGDGTYSGGITGVDWCREQYTEDNPFINYTNEQIWNIAEQNRNLNQIFSEFRSIYGFAEYIDLNRHKCIAGTPY